MRLSDLQAKNIVNMADGRNIGNIIDVKINNSGNIESLIVEPTKQGFRIFNKDEEKTVLWSDIEKIGEDVILVKSRY